MQVEIGNLVSTVRAVDGDALLAPQTLHRIVCLVLQAVEQRDAHRKRVRAEQRITPGVSHEMENEE